MEKPDNDQLLNAGFAWDVDAQASPLWSGARELRLSKDAIAKLQTTKSIYQIQISISQSDVRIWKWKNSQTVLAMGIEKTRHFFSPVLFWKKDWMKDRGI